MAICFLLKEVIVFLCIVEILNADRDLLETINLNADNPPEVNDFLHNVIQHKQVFSWIRHAARVAGAKDQQQMTPYRNDMQAQRYDKPGSYMKRNVRNRRPINDVHPYVYEGDILNEESAVRSLLRKRRRQRNYPRSRRSKGSVSLDASNEPDNGEVKVAPRSEAGVLNVPGEKYGGKRGIKRTCDDEYEVHPHIHVRANTTKSNATSNGLEAEYYFTTPHDILGLEQELSREYEQLNGTCIEVKKAAVRRDDSSVAHSTEGTTVSPSSTFTVIKSVKAQGPNQFYQQQQQTIQQPQNLQSTQILQRIALQQRQNIQPTMYQSQLQSQYPQYQTQAAQNKSANVNMNDQKGQDFAKLIRYVEAPSHESQAMSKQDLLQKDSDDVLENIDRVLKSDRSGMHLFREMPYTINSKKNDASEKDAGANQNQNQNHNGAADPNKVTVKRRSSNFERRRKKKLRNNKSGNKRMDVDITLNAQPISAFNSEKKAGKSTARKITVHKKKPKNHHQFDDKLSFGDIFNKEAMIDPFPKIDQQTSEAQQQMLADPNLKIMENADDENNDNLKQTLKEYINRQNEYNLERQPADDNEEITPDYQLVQEKKNMLEDQTEPTSAAEQRELGRKDPYVTPSLLNDSESDNALIVIPLKKSTSDVAISGKGEFESSKDGFRVKEAKDVIHIRTHPKDASVYKKETDQSGFDDSVFTKTVFDRIKDDLKETSRFKTRGSNDPKNFFSRAKYKSGDYTSLEDGMKKENDKLENDKASDNDYGNYDNFDLKRDTNFKSRKLRSMNYDDSSMYEAKIRRKRNVESFDLAIATDSNTIDLVKRSEEDEPDEEPGNDTKEPVEHEKKTQRAHKSNQYAPKVEEGSMTLHMDPSYETKRNDSDNDFPPDDENDSCGTKGANKSPPVINYNYFNITVNMISTTTPACDTAAKDDSSQCDQETSPGNGPQTGPPTNDNEQIEQLAQDILQYTASTKKKLVAAQESQADSKYQEQAMDKEKDPSKLFPTESEDGDSDRKDIKNTLHLTPVKQILSRDDEMEDRNVQRSVDNKKYRDTEDEDEREQNHGIRSAVEDAKHRELLVSKLERLVNSYKPRVQNQVTSDTDETENIDKRSNDNNDGEGFHHYQHKKKIPQGPRPDCDSPVEKHVIRSNRVEFIKPQEVYYEPESMADDLKEKLLFNKIYNRVIRKRKKIPDPFMYKIIDSVFGNDDDLNDDMCPVKLEEGLNAGQQDVPVKRTNQNEKRGEMFDKDINTEEDGIYELDDVSRKKKKTENVDEVLEKNLEERLDKWNEPSSMIKKQVDGDSKIQLNNVDSFRDVIESPNKGLSKREISGRNLEDIPKSYLSPMDENVGREKLRERRRLKFLHKPHKKKVRQINYEDYAQAQRLAGKRTANKPSPGQTANFNGGQNSKVKSQNKPVANNNTAMGSQALKAGVGSARLVNITSSTSTSKSVQYKLSEKNCSADSEQPNTNASKMIECELAKKEHEDMRRMLNGFLPLKIIDAFYERLKENAPLYNRFGGTIANTKQCASENAHNIKAFREEQAKVDIKQAEEMLHEVIIMLNQIVADQVHRRTCLQLAPNLRIYVIRITKNLRNMKKNNQISEGYPLPKIKSRSGEDLPLLPPEEDQGDFLFGLSGEKKSFQHSSPKGDINKKIKLIERLIEKYQSMSTRCQVQVEPVKDYLLKHLGMLMKLLEKSKDTSTCAPTTKNEEPVVNDEELAPPRGNITIPKTMVALDDEPVKSTTLGLDVNLDTKKSEGSEVSQRQQVLLRKHQEEEEKKQQLLLQRQVQAQEMLRRIQEDRMRQEQQQIEQVQQQQNQLQALPQQLRPFREDIRQRQSEGFITENGERSQNVNMEENVDNRAVGQHAQSNPQLQQPSSGAPKENNPPQSSPANTANVSSTVATIVQKELDPNGNKYSNPEMVTKNLMAMGLDGVNTYLPPFDVNQMVQENVINTNIAANAKGELIPHIGNQPAPAPVPAAKPPPKTGPKKRDVFEQELNYDRFYDTDEAARNNEKSDIERLIRKENREIRQNAVLIQPKPQALAPRASAPQASQPQAQPIQTPPPQGDQAGKQAWDPSKPDLKSYGNNQFIWQPLLVKATEIPDPDVDDTENYIGPKYSNPQMVNKDLVELGLDGEINSYVMPFTLNSVIESQMKASAQNTEPKISMLPPATVLAKTRRDMKKSHYNVSEKYKKLLDTYNTLRDKRQNEERIGKLYGTKSLDDKVGGFKEANKDLQDMSKVSFEKPIVFSLEG